MNKRHMLLALSLSLVACSGSGPGGPAPGAFFQTQPEFAGTLPPGARETTAADFMNLVRDGAQVITVQDLDGEKAAQQQQDSQDTHDAREYIKQHPEFRALLSPPAPDAINADGDRLVSVPTAKGAKNVVLLGPAFGRSVLATHARTFAGRQNQARLYAETYPDLDWALRQLGSSAGQQGLPAPADTLNMDAAQLLRLNRQVADIASQYAAEIADLKILLDPPSLEVGSRDQLDRSQKGACKDSASLGLLRNVDWPLKSLTTSVKDQGQRGTCWAFATVAALEAEIARRDRKTVNLSEQHYIASRFLGWAPRAFGDGGDPIFIAHKASEAGYSFAFEKGWQYNKSLSRQVHNSTETYTRSCENYQDATYDHGVCSDTNFQGHLKHVTFGGRTYLLRSLPNTGSSSGYRLQAPSNFWDQADKERSMTILLLRSVLGHASAITLDMSYVEPDANGYAPIKSMKTRADGTADFNLSHVMTVTGFISSQSLAKRVPGAPIADDYGYFIVKNSWGDCWGDQGYVYLPWTWVKTFTGQLSTGLAPQ